MKLINKVDKQALLALSAPVGFVITSIIFHYLSKALGLGIRLSIVVGIPVAAVFGSLIGCLVAQRIFHIEVSLVRLIIGAVLGYEFGIGLELLAFHLQKMAFSKDFVYFCGLVMLLCGYLGALIGQGFLTQESE